MKVNSDAFLTITMGLVSCNFNARVGVNFTFLCERVGEFAQLSFECLGDSDKKRK